MSYLRRIGTTDVDGAVYFEAYRQCLARIARNEPGLANAWALLALAGALDLAVDELATAIRSQSPLEAVVVDPQPTPPAGTPAVRP